ncbi:MAG: adenylate/guanylate cyclase domain-containing protein [Flavobacteriales bacterium]|nr:adenylate/guanylate cyclase domain-containing protein [Flavobacteriales bacterium]
MLQNYSIKEFFRHFRIYFFTIALIAGLWSFGRTSVLLIHDVQVDEHLLLPHGLNILFPAIIIMISSALLSAALSLSDVFVLNKVLYRKSLFSVILIAVFTQSIILNLIYSFVSTAVDCALEFVIGHKVEISGDHETHIWIIFIIFAIVLSRFFIEIDRKIGPGNIWKLISGKFYRPHEEDRIFMFIDLKDSTVIAEKLGHLKYSKLIQDCFSDLSVISKYKAEIYQYVGDEVVISWKAHDNIEVKQCFDAFFAFQNELLKKESYYMENYGTLPHFKAGIHLGPVVVAEVGRIKREISYHGDTMNTAARIQGKCNDLDASFLASEDIVNSHDTFEHYQINDVGEISLKGKANPMRLFKIIPLAVTVTP